MCIINKKANVDRRRGELHGSVLQCWVLCLTGVLTMETWS